MNRILTTTAIFAAAVFAASSANAADAAVGTGTNLNHDNSVATENNIENKDKNADKGVSNRSTTGLNLSSNPNQPVRNSVGRADNPIANTNASTSIPVEGGVSANTNPALGATPTVNTNGSMAAQTMQNPAPTSVKVHRGTTTSTVNTNTGINSNQ